MSYKEHIIFFYSILSDPPENDVLLCFCHFPILCPGTGVVLDCIDSWYLPSLLCFVACEAWLTRYDDIGIMTPSAFSASYALYFLFPINNF